MTDAEVADRSDRWRLFDEREFLQRSLDDAAREHAAGDLADDDYALLRRRDEVRLAAVETAIAAEERPAGVASATCVAAGTATATGSPLGSEGAAEGAIEDDPAHATEDDQPERAGAGGRLAPRRGVRRRTRAQNGVARPARGRRSRRWLAMGGVALLVGGGILLAVELAAPRLPGQTPTGSIDLTSAQEEQRQLTQAQDLVDEKHPAEALQLYGDVLSEDPKNPIALAEWGWLEWQSATQAKQSTAAVDAQAAVQRAVTLDPGLFVAQYYLGTIFFDDGQASQAVTHFTEFLSDQPTATWLSDAAPTIRSAFTAAGQPVPAGLPATSPAAG